MSMDVANPYRTVIQVISLIYMGYYTLVDGAGLRCGGEGGIRTPENLSDLHAFQACALSRARPPLRERPVCHQGTTVRQIIPRQDTPSLLFGPVRHNWR